MKTCNHCHGLYHPRWLGCPLCDAELVKLQFVLILKGVLL